MAAKIDSSMRTLIRLSAMIILLPPAVHAGASVDGRVALPNTAVVQQLFSSCIAHGGAELDHSALITLLRDD